MNWLTINIYYHLQDELIVMNRLRTVVSNIIRPYYPTFYIRYFDDYHHIRLRIKAENKNHQKLYDHVLYFCRNDQVLKNLKIKKGEYMPEIQRYGGALGIETAEHLFELSSLCTLNTLFYKDENLTYSKIIFRAAILNFLTLRAFCDNGIQEKKIVTYFLHLYAPDPKNINSATDKYIDQDVKNLKAVIQIFDENENDEQTGLFYFYNEYFKSLKKIRNQINDDLLENYELYEALLPHSNSLEHFLISIMHMNNNRMAIKFFDEHRIAYLMTKMYE